MHPTVDRSDWYVEMSRNRRPTHATPVHFHRVFKYFPLVLPQLGLNARLSLSQPYFTAART
jgi:hypothetical protein